MRLASRASYAGRLLILSMRNGNGAQGLDP
jgi:hypothetical protein